MKMICVRLTYKPIRKFLLGLFSILPRLSSPYFHYVFKVKAISHISSSIWSLIPMVIFTCSCILPLGIPQGIKNRVYASTYIKIPVRQSADVKIILNFKLRSIYFVTMITSQKSLWCMIYIFTWTCHMFPYFSLLIPLDKCIFTISKYPEKLTMYITNYLSFVFWENEIIMNHVLLPIHHIASFQMWKLCGIRWRIDN